MRRKLASMYWLAIGAFALLGLMASPAGAAPLIDSNDVFTVPAKDVHVKRLSKRRATVRLHGVESHGLIVSTDGKEETEALPLRHFHRNFRKLGLGGARTMRVVTHGAGGKLIHTDYSFGRLRFNPRKDELVVHARIVGGKRVRSRPKQARMTAAPTPSVSFSQKPPVKLGPVIMYFPLTGTAMIQTSVYGDYLSDVNVAIRVAGQAVYAANLNSRSAWMADIELGDGNRLAQGELSYTKPGPDRQPGEVSLKANLLIDGVSRDVNWPIASWYVS